MAEKKRKTKFTAAKEAKRRARESAGFAAGRTNYSGQAPQTRQTYKIAR